MWPEDQSIIANTRAIPILSKIQKAGHMQGGSKSPILFPEKFKSSSAINFCLEDTALQKNNQVQVVCKLNSFKAEQRTHPNLRGKILLALLVQKLQLDFKRHS